MELVSRGVEWDERGEDERGRDDSGYIVYPLPAPLLWVYLVSVRDPGWIALLRQLDLPDEYQLTLTETYAQLYDSPGRTWYKPLNAGDSPDGIAEWVRDTIKHQPSWIDEPDS